MNYKKMNARAGGVNRHATSYADTIIDLTAAAAILKRPMSTVRSQAKAGELPVSDWVGDRPYFKAGDLMALSPS